VAEISAKLLKKGRKKLLVAKKVAKLLLNLTKRGRKDAVENDQILSP
jgi:hypothetical protein